MKKYLLSLAAAAMLAMPASAQFMSSLNKVGIFNHLGVDVNVGTTGIGFELSTPITPWVQLRGGASFMPNIKFHADVDGTFDYRYKTPLGLEDRTQDFTVNADAGLGRTQGHVVFNVYPFGKLNSFFVAVGAYMGGKRIVKIDGHSNEIEALINDPNVELYKDGIDGFKYENGYVEVGDYKIGLDKQGNVHGGLMVNSFRPYLGLGYGRPCPGKRLGFMVELGVQFMGKMKVYEGNYQKIEISDLTNDDDWQKWMNKLTVYPVLRFTLSGRIL